MSNTVFSQKQEAHTDKTDETHVLGVLGACSSLVFKKSGFTKKAQEHTDETDKSGVSSVLSAHSLGFLQKMQGVLSVSSVHSSLIFVGKRGQCRYTHSVTPVKRDRDWSPVESAATQAAVSAMECGFVVRAPFMVARQAGASLAGFAQAVVR